MMWEMMSEEEPSQGKWHCESDNGSERSSKEDEVAEWGGGADKCFLVLKDCDQVHMEE